MNARLTIGKAARTALIAISIAGLSACTHKPPPHKPPPTAETVVARLNGRPVWASDVRREAVAQGLIGKDEPLDASSVLFHQVMDEVVDQKLLAGEAVRRGLDRGDEGRRRLLAARDRVLADMVLENAVAKAVSKQAVDGLYQAMLRNQPPGVAPITLEAAQPQIIRFLTYDQVKDLILDLRRAARIESLIPPLPPAPAAATATAAAASPIQVAPVAPPHPQKGKARR
jgi:hypothetical protein